MSAAQARLVRALIGAAGGGELVDAHSRDWRSATFAGTRHAIRLRADAGAGARLAALPPEALRVPGQLVAHLAVVAEAGAPLCLDVLTLEAG